MEGTTTTSLISRKNEARSLFKKCFKNSIFSLVPFEIWRDFIISNADLKTIVVLSQTCYAFKELVENIGENNFNLALLFRKEGQIALARKYLFKSANNGNSFAMFHLGFAYRYRGWGICLNEEKSYEWCKKSAELGNAHGMAYAYHSNFYLIDNAICAEKILSSKNFFVLGYCYFWGLGTEANSQRAFSYFEAAANEGDEFGQEYLAYCFRSGQGVKASEERALYWYLKSADQGHYESQYFVGNMYRYGRGCKKDKQKAIIWFKKSARQGNESSKKALIQMGVKID